MKRPAFSILLALLFTCVSACSFSKSVRESNANSSPAATPAVQASTAPATINESHPTAPTSATTETKDELHTPEKGSEERQAIMDALRGNQQVVFQVNYLKVHNGWCWVDTTPLDSKGRVTAEGGPNLLHQENGRWKVMDLSRVPDDPNDPLGSENASPAYVKNVIKAFPGVPRDIFPKSSN